MSELQSGTLIIRCKCGAVLTVETRTGGYGESDRIQCGACGYVTMVQIYVIGLRAGTTPDRVVQP